MLTDELGPALERAAASQPFLPDPERALVRARRLRHRRRTLGAATGVAAVAAVAAVSVGLTAVSPGGTGSVTPPAAPAARPVLASDYGVDVTWLPPGFEPDPAKPGAATNTGPDAKPGSGWLTWNFWRGTTAHFRLEVKRGDPGPDPLDTMPNHNKKTATTVRGRPATLVVDSSDVVPGHLPTLVLVWTERPGVDIRLYADQPGVPLAQARRIAEGLIVHATGTIPPPTLEDEKVAVAAATENVLIAWPTASPPTDPTSRAMVARVQELNGGRLAGGRSMVRSIVIRGNTATADVDVNISAAYQHYRASVTLRRVDGQWQLTPESACAALTYVGGTCPAG